MMLKHHASVPLFAVMAPHRERAAEIDPFRGLMCAELLACTISYGSTVLPNIMRNDMRWLAYRFARHDDSLAD